MKDTPIQLLLVEDNSLDVRLLREMLSRQAPRKFELIEVGSMTDAESHLATKAADIILLDLGLPDARGLEAVRRAHAAAPRIPLVVLTGCDDELMADLALQEGAQDFLVKGQIETPGLLRAIRYATQRVKAENEMQKAQEETEAANRAKGELLVELKAAYAETELFLRSIPSILIGMDAQGRITRWNLPATNTFGVDARSAEGQTVEDSSRLSREHPGFDPRIFQALADVDGGGKHAEIRACDISELIPYGMVLEEELRTKTGMLLVAKGQEVTPTLILKLENFLERGNHRP
jgi:DNA-binding NarL/FixJ family response regulator